MLATLSDKRDFPGEWIFERKLDGIRVLSVRDGNGVKLLSRTGRRLNATYSGEHLRVVSHWVGPRFVTALPSAQNAWAPPCGRSSGVSLFFAPISESVARYGCLADIRQERSSAYRIDPEGLLRYPAGPGDRHASASILARHVGDGAWQYGFQAVVVRHPGRTAPY
jgi:hypothetical protein